MPGYSFFAIRFFMKFSDDLSVIKGIGEKTAPLYRKLGMNNVEDVVHYFPRDYIYYEKSSQILPDDSLDLVSIKVKLISKPLLRTVGRYKIVTAKFLCDKTEISATWFNMPYLAKSLVVDEPYVLRGVVIKKGSVFHFEQPSIFKLEQYEKIEDSFLPVYPLTKGLSNNALIKTEKICMKECNIESSDLYRLHFPKNEEELIKARNIFVYEEFLLFILRLRLLKQFNERAKNDFNIIPVAQTRRIIEKLPYRLTDAQMRVFTQVENDLCSNNSMSRLIQGDVGCGKTIIAFLACITCAINGYQSAVMAPTEILATQHFETFTKMIQEYNLDIEVVLLTGGTSAKEKKSIKNRISNLEAKIIIGTHALIQESVVYSNLALVITDEQHRFGVNQREHLADKNNKCYPHVLVMSATPIPRTLAIILYGDIDISVIDEVPARRLPIKNCVVNIDYRNSAYSFMKKEIASGHQVYVICPLVEQSERTEITDVMTYAEKLKSIFPDDINIAVMHGKLKNAVKQKVMDDFFAGNIDILVSTTVVEVGVNVPNATVMLIEDADRFGLAQLHQLRGRIGRGDAQSYCIFMSGSNSKKSMERLSVLNNSNDGFKIASYDLKQRGPGDIFGIRQSGEMSFKLADIYTDASILEKASKDANDIVLSDPDLSKEEHRELRKKLFNDDGTVKDIYTL